MTEFTDADLSGSRFTHVRLKDARFERVDLTGARFSMVDLNDVDIHGAELYRVRMRAVELMDVEIDGELRNVVINGVDIGPLVDAELDRRDPDRPLMRPTDPAGFRAAWDLVEQRWGETVERARQLDPALLHESVNGEWSFVQTLRHLVFAIDKWFTSPVLGDAFHPIGLPNSGSIDFPWPGLDYDLTPSLAEALAVRADRAGRFRDFLVSVAPADFTRPIDVLENGTNPLQECIYTVFEEEFWHNRYALRDLAQLEAAR
jgi:hypothetical protein